MSKFTDCINGTTLSAKQKSNIIDDYQEQLNSHIRNGSDPVKAELDAAEEIFDKVVQKNVDERGAYLYNIRTASRHQDAIKNLSDDELIEYSVDAVERAYTLGSNGVTDALMAPIADMVDKATRRVTGQYKLPFYSSQKDMEQIVRAAFDETLSGPSSDIAKGIQRANDMSIDMMAEAGIKIQKDPLYRLPQNHLVERMTGKRDQWIKTHNKEGFLDWDNMKDFSEGRPIPTTVEGKAELLGRIFDTIITNGNIKDKKGVIVNSVAAKYAHRRFLRYASADAWLEAHKKYGENDILGTVVGHLKSVGMDIALAREFGNQPLSMIKNINTMTLNRAAKLDTALEQQGKKAKFGGKVAEMNKAAEEMHRIASFGHKAESKGFFSGLIGGGVNLMAAGKLGFTSIPAILTDSTLRHITRREMGAGAAPEIVRFASSLTNKSQRIQAVRLGAGVHTLVRQTVAAERFMGELFGGKLSRGFAEATVRFSRLAQITTSGRHAFTLDTFGQFGDYSKTRFSKLPDNMKTWLKRYNITSKEWDVFRATKKTSDSSGALIAPISLLDRTDIPYSEAFRLFEKFSLAVNAEMERAIPSVTLRARQAKGEYIREATVVGAATRATMQFKAWPTTMYYLHLRNGWRRGGVKAFSYLTTLGTSLTIAGAISIQIQNILQGRDVEKMDNLNFWMRSAFKGGSGAIIADIIANGADIVDGPLHSFAKQLGRLSKLGMKKLADGRDAGLLAEFLKFTKDNLPVVNSWQLDLVTDRVLENAIQTFDPVGHNKMRRRRKKYLRSKEKSEYWRYGKTEPDRAPEFDLY